MKTKLLSLMIPLLGFMLFFIQGDNYAASPLLIKIAEDFGIDISRTGLSVVSYILPFGIFTIFFGPLGDKYGKIKLINIAAFGTALFSALGGIAPNFIVLCIFRAFNGAFSAAIMPVSMALIGEVAGENPDSLHSAVSRTMGLMFFGGAVSPFIGGTLSYFGSWRLVYVIYGIAEFILAVCILVFLRVKSKQDKDLTFRKAYSDALSDRTLIKVVALMSLIGFIVLGTFTYTGKYIESSTGYSVFQVGFLLTSFGLGTLLGSRLSVRLKRKLKKGYFMVSSMIGFISLLMLAYLPGLSFLVLAIFGFGFTFTLMQPVLVAQAQGIFPGKRGTVMSLASFNMCLGAAIGTLLNGVIIKQWGFITVYVLGSLLFLIVGALATRVISKSKFVF